jgi:hypothetical protein
MVFNSELARVFEAKPKSWIAASYICVTTIPPEFQSSDGIDKTEIIGLYVLQEDAMLISNLKTNFFSTELMEFDSQNATIGELVDFVASYGFPYSPFRELIPSSQRKRYHEESMDVINKTIAVYNKLFDSNDIDGFTNEGYNLKFVSAISVDEAIFTIRILQDIVRTLTTVVSEPNKPLNESQLDALSWIDLAASNRTSVNVHGRNTNWMNLGLTSAIANQIIETMEDEAEWRFCKCCNRLYKRKRHKVKPSANSPYCSQTCYETQYKRDSRKAAKQTNSTTTLDNSAVGNVGNEAKRGGDENEG